MTAVYREGDLSDDSECVSEFSLDQPDGMVEDIAMVVETAIERDDRGSFVRVNMWKALGALVSLLLIALFTSLFVLVQAKLTGNGDEMNEQLEFTLEALQKLFRDNNASIVQ